MTDRINALIVTLEHNEREDDVERLIQAIEMFQGVLSVKLHVASIHDHVAEERVRHSLSEKLWSVLYKDKAQGT